MNVAYILWALPFSNFLGVNVRNFGFRYGKYCRVFPIIAGLVVFRSLFGMVWDVGLLYVCCKILNLLALSGFATRYASSSLWIIFHANPFKFKFVKNPRRSPRLSRYLVLMQILVPPKTNFFIKLEYCPFSGRIVSDVDNFPYRRFQRGECAFTSRHEARISKVVMCCNFC